MNSVNDFKKLRQSFVEKTGRNIEGSAPTPPLPNVTKHEPADIEERKQCVRVAHECHLFLVSAKERIHELDKAFDRPEVLNTKRIQFYEEVVQHIDRCLHDANWEVSLFFKGLAGQFRDLQTKLQQGLDQVKNHGTEKLSLDLTPPNMRKVFVLLYLTDGNNLKKWVSLLSNLSTISIGRPVYQNEQQIQSLIRSKPDARFDAYVAVYVNEKEVIEPLGKIIPKDKLGNELLTLREGAIKPQYIIEFVRLISRPEQRYHFIDGELLLIK